MLQHWLNPPPELWSCMHVIESQQVVPPGHEPQLNWLPHASPCVPQAEPAALQALPQTPWQQASPAMVQGLHELPAVPQEPVPCEEYPWHVPSRPPLQHPLPHEFTSQMHWPEFASLAVSQRVPLPQGAQPTPPRPHDVFDWDA